MGTLQQCCNIESNPQMTKKEINIQTLTVATYVVKQALSDLLMQYKYVTISA